MTSRIGYFPDEQNENEPEYIDINSLPDKKPGMLSEGMRHVARSASRAGERIAGGLGDIYKSLDQVIEGVEKISPFPEPVSKAISTGLKLTAKGPVGLINKPPTSSDLKQASLESTDGYTAAKNSLEKGLDEIVENTTSMMLGGGPVRGGHQAVQGVVNRFARNLGVSLSGQLAKEGVKELGGSETQQEAARTGTMVLGTLLGTINPKEIWTRLYNLRDSRITPNTSVPSQGLINDFAPIRAELQRGGTPTPAAKRLLEEMNTIESKAVNGQIPINDLTAWQQQLSRLRQTYPEIKFDNRQINPISQANQKAIQQFNDPVFQAAHKQANEVYGVAAQTGKMADFIQRNLPKSMQGGFLGQLLGSVITSPAAVTAGQVGKAAATAGAGAGIYHVGSLVNHVMKSPVLRKEYSQLLGNAARENAPAMIQNARKIEDALDEKKIKRGEFEEAEDYISLDDL